MRDEEKTKEELISELEILRKKYTELKEFLLKNQQFHKTGCTETLLVVDDNKETRTAIVEMLGKYGYTLLDADSSRKAIEIVNAYDGKIHLVLSDVVMPEINGPEMVTRILDLKPEIRVVFMSGYAADEIIHDDVFKILHMHSAFIEKPFTFEEIGLMIRQQLDKTI